MAVACWSSGAAKFFFFPNTTVWVGTPSEWAREEEQKCSQRLCNKSQTNITLFFRSPAWDFRILLLPARRSRRRKWPQPDGNVKNGRWEVTWGNQNPLPPMECLSDEKWLLYVFPPLPLHLSLWGPDWNQKRENEWFVAHLWSALVCAAILFSAEYEIPWLYRTCSQAISTQWRIASCHPLVIQGFLYDTRNI